MAAKYDLTPRVAPHLDRHLVFPLLEFLQERGQYPEEDILKAKIELLNHTNMVDYAMDIHKSLYRSEDVPQGVLLIACACGRFLNFAGVFLLWGKIGFFSVIWGDGCFGFLM